MARISTYDDAHDNTVWVVERSNDSFDGRKEFHSYAEAELYKNYLQSIENQEKALSQNQQIIKNQQTIIEQNSRSSSFSPRFTPPPTQHIVQSLDPEYEEWLRYKKATDPEYKKWKAEEERKKAAKRAELLRQQAAEKEAERKEREEKEKKREEEWRRYREKKEKEEKEQKEKILTEILPFESQIINGEDVTIDIKSKVARYTNNQAVIDVLKETDIERILRKLRENEFLNSDDEAYIKKKQSAIRKAKEQKRKLEKEKEKQLKIAQEKKNNSGCAGILLFLIIPSLLATLLFVL